jgi:hypothetical protein
VRGLICPLLVAGLAGGAFAADPFTGVWKLNTAKSTGTVPKEETVVIREDAGKLVVEVSIVDSRPGNPKLLIRYAAPAHGGMGTTEAGPYNGVSLKRPSAKALETTYLVDGKKVRSTRAVVSADGKTMSSTGSTAESSEQTSWVMVFEKQ